MQMPTDLEPWLRRVGVGAAFRALAELIPGAAVLITDPDRRLVYASPECARLLRPGLLPGAGGLVPDGVLTEDGELRPDGATAHLPDAGGGTAPVRHYLVSLAGPDGPAGHVHLLVLDAGAASTSAAPPEAAEVVEFHGLATRDPAMIRLIQVVKNVAETDATVLVRGESGTGKELVARAIHAESRRHRGPFVAVNCAAFTPTLLESELFGHTRGAYTGAVGARKGIFAQADGGVLFLDEVAELPLDLQAKLLRVLQERRFVPVGGTEEVEVDVRVIAATHRALREEARAGRFREDLMYRLRVVPIFLPALRQRPLDIDLLLRRTVDEFNRRGPRRVTGFTPEATRALHEHPWPGNVRELRNVLEHAFAVGRGPLVGLDELPPELREVPPAEPSAAPADEAARVRAALDAAGGDLDHAAARLGVSRTTFWRMRRRAGI